MPRKNGRPYTEAEILEVLTCVVAWSGNVEQAVAQLKRESRLPAVPAYTTVCQWTRQDHVELYNNLREQYAAQIDRDLADRYRGVAAQAVEVTELAVKAARDRLEAGQEKDPARAAANLAMAANKTLHDYSVLEGRPTQIQEARGLSDVMRTLVDLGVLVPHAAPQLKASVEVVEDET